jgi:hypothetical protein
LPANGTRNLASPVVYNGIRPFLGETDTQSRLEWISTLDKLEALNPKAVIAGHKVPENEDDLPHHRRNTAIPSGLQPPECGNYDRARALRRDA